jgi:hypothetical protein
MHHALYLSLQVLWLSKAKGVETVVYRLGLVTLSLSLPQFAPFMDAFDAPRTF